MSHGRDLLAMVTQRKKRWSQQVTETSDALTLDPGVFTRENPRSIAQSLKRSADSSRRRKTDPFRSAMSMLTFYLNRAGRNLPAAQRRTLEQAKDELRRCTANNPARLLLHAAPDRTARHREIVAIVLAHSEGPYHG